MTNEKNDDLYGLIVAILLGIVLLLSIFGILGPSCSVILI